MHRHIPLQVIDLAINVNKLNFQSALVYSFFYLQIQQILLSMKDTFYNIHTRDKVGGSPVISLSFRKALIILNLVTILSLGPTKSEATYTSVKSLGMAGAVAAHPLDSLVAAYNPGGLGFVGNRWDLGLHWVNRSGRTEFKDNDLISGDFNSHSSWENLFIPEFAVNKYTCECAFTWGFAIYNRSFFKTNYDEKNPIFGTSKPGLEYLHYVAAPTCTVIIACDHCIGATLDFHGQRLKVDGLENFDNDDFSDSPGNVTNNGYNYSGGIGGTIGWMSKVSDCVSIGAAWSPTVKMSRFEDYRGLVARHGRVNIPQRFLGGVAIEMVCGFTAAFDIEHVKYNEISPLNHMLLPRLNKKELGEDKGAGLGWRDQTIFRLGFDWKIEDYGSMRFGYSYHRDPIKSSETLANTLLPNITERVITWGGSFMCGPCDEFSFYSAFAFRSSDHGKDSIPESLGGGEANLNESKWMAGITWGKYF